MLGKLFKYEWKSVYKLNSIMILAIFVVTLIGCIIFQTPLFSGLCNGEGNMGDMQEVIFAFIMFIGFIFYVFMLVGVTYGILIYFGMNFYKSMYSENGYLTHTLPVTANQLLLSKTLVAGIWYILILLAIMLSIMALTLSCVVGIVGPLSDVTVAECMEELWLGLKLYLDSEYGGFIIRWLIYALVVAIVSPFAKMIMLFGGLTIGQLSKKHRGLMGILAYIGITVVYSILISITQFIFSIKMAFKSLVSTDSLEYMNNIMNTSYSSFFIMLILAVVLYWSSHQIITKKLNME